MEGSSTSTSNGAGPSGVASTSPFLNPTSQQLRKLVLDYLCHQCYVSTANILTNSQSMDEVLAEKAKELGMGTESSLDDAPMETGDSSASAESSSDVQRAADEGMLKSAAIRAAIRECILDGDIYEARRLLDEYFPAVLKVHKTTHHSSRSAAATPETAATAGTQDSGASADKAQSLEYNCPVSLDPRHLILNLRIQEFIECLRTVPVTRTRPTSTHLPASLPLPFTRTRSDSSPVRKPTQPDTQKLLEQAQELWCMMSELPSAEDKVLYMEELQNVGALIAYQVPETSPVSKYLSIERREAVAGQINCAILYRTNQAPLPYLQRYAEHTTVVWNLLEALGASLPPPASWPPGVALSPLGARTSGVRVSITKGNDEDSEIPVPPFYLNRFVGP